MPPSSWIENMWYSNPDGAGFMYADKGKVHIRKGYMDIDDFNDALLEVGNFDKLKDLPIVMHFRIGTAGGNVPANTHPFPISDSIPVLQKLSCTANVGVVHNGVIPVTPRQKNISDTMEYIAATLAPLYRYDHEFYRSKDLLQMIGNQTGSKLAFMNAAGQIFTIGTFSEDNGLLFSNTSYLSGYFYRRTPTNFYGLYGTDYDHQYDEWFDEGETYIDDLMLLDNGCYLVNMDNGNFYDCDDYTIFMDSADFLYVYDEKDQGCYPLSDKFQAFNARGNAVAFSKDDAWGMLVFTDGMIYDLPESIPDEPDDDNKKNDGETQKDMPF